MGFSDLSPENTISDDQTGIPALVAPNGSLKISELIRVAGGNFGTGTILSHLYTTASTGSGSTTQADSEVTLATGITANSDTAFQTAVRARFTTATFNETHQPLSHTDFDATNCITKWGIFDPADNIISGDGVYFKNDSGTISLERMKGGVIASTVAEGSFNGGNTFVKNETLHLYKILYNAGSAFFYQDSKLIHKMAYGEIGYETVHLTAGTSIENTNGNTTNNSIVLYGLAVARLGAPSAINRCFSIDTATSGVINDVPSRLVRIVITELGTGSATLKMYDSTDSSSNRIFSIDLSKELISLDIDVETSNALSYVTTGAGFEVLVVYN